MTTEQLNLFPGRRCSFCRQFGAEIRIEVTPPDDLQQVYRFFCSAVHLAYWETNQPPPNIPLKPIKTETPASEKDK